MLRARNRAAGPFTGRLPHPDPRTEARLQEVITCQQSADRLTALAAQLRTELSEAGDMHDRAARRLGMRVSLPQYRELAQAARARQDAAWQRISQTEQQIAAAAARLRRPRPARGERS